MKIVALLVALSCGALIACTAGTEHEIGGAQENLSRRSGGTTGASCPGGTSAACVICTDDKTCAEACAGGYTCERGPNFCAGTRDCRTSGIAPTSVGGVR